MPWRNELQQQHADRQANGLSRTLRAIQSSPGRTIESDGKSFLNFCSNNYLSLSGHPKLIEAANAANKKWGVSTTASHLIVGHTALHQELEERIAEFVGAEKAILFSTGYMANLAIPSTFLDRHDAIIQDRLNHASIIDAARLCGAKLKRYAHRDPAAAAELLTSDHRRKMLVTDGVFSMDGDIAPLSDLQDACKNHNAVMVVDDAHGFGVIGQSGKGTLSQFGIAPNKNVLMLGTLSKAAGSFGAFVAGDSVYIETLIQHARPFIYTTALPCSAVAAALAAIELMETEPWRQEKLHENIALFRKLASQAGVALLESTTPIQPVIIGDIEAVLARSAQLQQQGIMAVAIRPPTVPVDQSRIRITLMTDHTEEDVVRLVEALKQT